MNYVTFASGDYDIAIFNLVYIEHKQERKGNRVRDVDSIYRTFRMDNR